MSTINKDVKPKTTTGKCTNALRETTRKYKNGFINRTDLDAAEQLLPLNETGIATKTRPVTHSLVHLNGKFINLINF